MFEWIRISTGWRGCGEVYEGQVIMSIRVWQLVNQAWNENLSLKCVSNNLHITKLSRTSCFAYLSVCSCEDVCRCTEKTRTWFFSYIYYKGLTDERKKKIETKMSFNSFKASFLKLIPVAECSFCMYPGIVQHVYPPQITDQHLRWPFEMTSADPSTSFFYGTL